MATQAELEAIKNGQSLLSPTGASVSSLASGGNTASDFLKKLMDFTKVDILSIGSVSNIDNLFTSFKNSLLAGRQESELSDADKTLLTQGTNIANNMRARLNAAQKAEQSPGAVTQTRMNQSLLGK